MATIITISRFIDDFNEEYFFSTDHCQPNLDGNEWVSCSHYNTSREEIKDQNENHYPILGASSVEIPNPDPNYQA